jgi:hypothetical protein
MKALMSDGAPAPAVQPPSSTSAAEIKGLINSHPGADRMLAIYTSLPANYQTTLLALVEK